MSDKSSKKAKEPKEKGYTVQALKRANSIALKANKKAYIAHILIALFMTVNTYISLWSTEYTVTSAYNLFTKDSDFMPILIGVSAFAASQLIFNFIGIVRNMMWNRLMLDVTYYFENNLNNKLSSIKWDYYHGNIIN